MLLRLYIFKLERTMAIILQMRHLRFRKAKVRDTAGEEPT